MNFVLALIMVILTVESRDLEIYRTDRRFNREDIDDLQKLPESEPLLPGHTLLRPSKTMLKSSAKFPTDLSNAVYGNYGNLGITHGTTSQRVLYTGFRKGNDMLANILNNLQKLKKNREHKKKQAIILINEEKMESKESRVRKKGSQKRNNTLHAKKLEAILNHGEIGPEEKDIVLVPEEENSASEILDPWLPDELATNDPDYRRKAPEDPYRERLLHYNTSSESDSESIESSDLEKNPGNPYTIFKNKYRQNWIWNHVMDGDHMNINPYGPALQSLDPSGSQIFFNRKWWYFNQDDYKPMG